MKHLEDPTSLGSIMPMLQALGGPDALQRDADYIKDMVTRNGGRMTPELMDRMEADMRRSGLSPAMQKLAQASAAAVARQVGCPLLLI